MNCFYPPKELEKRHPGLATLKKQVLEQEARGEHPNPDKQVVYVVRMFLCFASFTNFSERIRLTRNTMRPGSPTSRSL